MLSLPGKQTPDALDGAQCQLSSFLLLYNPWYIMAEDPPTSLVSEHRNLIQQGVQDVFSRKRSTEWK
jgi:hypothetical protein